ncbi:MAG TPA: hypothetical protein VFO69_00355 [Allosphingosinicella sp.]|nr:hypothetical protein [Allosphingosinicella sp.]
MSLRALKVFVRAAALCAAAVAAAPAPARPLFASDSTLRIRIEAPIQRIMRAAATSTDPHEGALSLTDPNQRHAIRVSARGLSRRRRESCTFPPLRVEFLSPPSAGTLFEGHERLKLVTHCRSQASFQQHILLEYAAYRLLNVLSPRSFRVRLVLVDYVESGRTEPMLSRYGFFIEDVDDVARRNGLREAATGNIALAQLSAVDTARFAMFQYMIGNIDWSAQTGPPGSGCCHNARLLGAARLSTTQLVPIAYDFDQSGLVDVPYAAIPAQLRLRSVRERRYRGYCLHGSETAAVIAEMKVARPSLEQALVGIPGMDADTRRSALSYLAGFFEDVETPQRVSDRLLRSCRGSGAD